MSSAVCTFTAVLSTSAPAAVDPKDVMADRQNLSAADYQSLLSAAIAGRVKSKQYSQSFNNIVDSVSQSGKFYYDGSRAWVTQSYRGYMGYHSCKTDWAVGYVVELKKCDESGSLSQRDLRAIWHFSVIPSGGRVNWDEEKHLYVNSAGAIWQ